jgi:hypothetical protein
MADPRRSAPPPTVKDAHSAPFIYFDLAPSFGVMAGAIEIELVARILIPGLDPQPTAEVVATAHLRCSPTAAASLRDALDKALELFKQLQEQAGAAAATAAAGKLN